MSPWGSALRIAPPTRLAAIARIAMIAMIAMLAIAGCGTREPAPEPVPSAAPTTAAPPVPSPAVESDVGPAAEPAPPVEPQPAPEPEPEPEPEQEPALQPESEPEPEPRAVAAPPAHADEGRELLGRIALSADDADPSETVVYFVPDRMPADPPPMPDASFEIATMDKQFQPPVLAVARGSEVRFPNRDPILHNVFSVSQGNAFDLGVYGPGTEPAVTLNESGAVNVYCNVHRDMHAHILVLDSPWFVRASNDGAFALNDLPPGPGVLHVWHRRAEGWSMPVHAGVIDSIVVDLQVVRPQIPDHLDKAGQSYQRRDRDPYR